MHQVLVEIEVPAVGQAVLISGEEAVHASRVKRLDAGDRLGLLDGSGTSAIATIESIDRGNKRDGPSIHARIVQRRSVPPVHPRVEVYTATPKGQRLDDMIDGLSQVGAAAWIPLETERGIVDPRESKLTRLERISREAAKQCGRAWLLAIGSPMGLKDVLASAAPTTRVMMADGSGGPFVAGPATATVRLLIGPEGGWTAEELHQARAAGATVASFGVHTMRIETAAVVATACILSGRIDAPADPTPV